jgi:hypothetical protein
VPQYGSRDSIACQIHGVPQYGSRDSIAISGPYLKSLAGKYLRFGDQALRSDDGLIAMKRSTPVRWFVSHPGMFWFALRQRMIRFASCWTSSENVEAPFFPGLRYPCDSTLDVTPVRLVITLLSISEPSRTDTAYPIAMCKCLYSSGTPPPHRREPSCWRILVERIAIGTAVIRNKSHSISI